VHCPTLKELPPVKNSGWPWTQESPRTPSLIPDGSCWPRISIVTPSFNQGQFVEETIRSVLLQGYPNLEYIIIDGGSTDNSVEIIKKYEQWLDYWVREPDNGQPEAINKGFERASGDIIAWLNSDDTYMEGTLAKVGTFFAKLPSVDLLCGGGTYIFHDGTVARQQNAKPVHLDEMLVRNSIIQPSSFFRKRVWEETGRLNDKLHFCFDYDLWLKTAKSYTICTHPDAFSYFRLHQNSKTFSQRFTMSVESTRVAINFLENQIQMTKARDQILRFCFFKLSVLYWFMNKEDDRVELFLKKSRPHKDLFQNFWLTQNIMLTFAGPVEMLNPNEESVNRLLNKIEEFYCRFVSQDASDCESTYLSYLVSRLYLTLASTKNKPNFFVKAFLNNPSYFLKLCWYKMLKYRELAQAWNDGALTNQ